MAVYVDKAKSPYGRMLMSHMLADSIEELFDMADAIGVKRKWFQDKSVPHFDVCQAKKSLALKKGAIEVDNRELVEIMRRLRQEGAQEDK